MISDIIKNKIVELKDLVNKKDSINIELKEVNNFLEVLNKLNEEMINLDISKLKNILKEYKYEINNIDELFTDVNNLIEYYIRIKKDILKIPFAYSIKIDEIKDNLKIIKNELENSLIRDYSSKEEIDLLNKLLLIINKESNEVEITKEMLKVLYERIIVNLNENERIVLYEILHDYNKKEIVEENKRSYNKSDELIDLFKDNIYYSKIKKFIIDNEDELLEVVDIENTKSIVEFLNKSNIINYFDPITLVYVSCYGKIDNVIKVKEELIKIKDIYDDLCKKKKINDDFPYDSFCNLLSVAAWLNPPIEKTEPAKKGRKPNDYKPIIMPKSIKNNNQNMANICANVKLICGDLQLLDLDYLSIRKLFNNSIIRDAQPYVLRKNLELAKAYKLHSLNISALKNDMEKRINYAIELGLLKAPKLNSAVYTSSVLGTLNNEKLKKQFEGLSYFEYNTSNLSTFTEKEFAYYTTILSKYGRNELYKKFYNSDHSINNHRSAPTFDAQIDYRNNFLNEKDLDKKEGDNDYQKSENEVVKINNFKEYADVLDDDTNRYISFDGNYFDPEIVYEDIVGTFERDFSIKNVDDPKDIENSYINDEYVYMFKNKLLSRYRILRNASILKQRYGFLSADMFLTCIVKDSFITEEEYIFLRNSEFFKEASFIEKR